MSARLTIAALVVFLLTVVAAASGAGPAGPTSPTTRPAPTPAPAANTSDWWNKDWPYRVRLNAPKSGADVAQATVNLAGRTTNDGHDLRLIDASGQQVPFAILHHDPRLSTLLAFKVAADQPFTGYLYYGHRNAPPFTPGKPSLNSPPWEPKRGLLLTVYRKSNNVMPKTLGELKDLIRASTQEGALYRSAVSDGSNPVGQSDNYISVYEGYLDIEKAGEYSFCSASADGSWIVVNGRTILEWPGPHDWSGAARGQKHGTITLEKGTARIQYYQEAGAGVQMAFMGWQPPGQDHFTGIPTERWLDLRPALATDYMARDKPVMAVAAVSLRDTYWVRDSDAQQTTLLEFADQSTSRAGKITQWHWTFGDGLEGGSAKTEHVYFHLGRPEITLTVTDDKGASDTATCAVPVYLVDVEGRTVAVGGADEHARLAGGYDTDKLNVDDLAGYADFWLGLERWPQAVAAVTAFVRRFPDIAPTGRLAAAGANAATQPLAFDPHLAERWFALAIARSIGPQEKMDLQLRRAENLAWNLNDGKAARAVFAEVEQAAGALLPPARKQTTRRCLIGMGDIALLAGELEKARQQYQRAQDVPMRRKPDQPEELAKLGSYPYAVDDLIGRREYEYALLLLDQWEDEFPVQKLEGNSFFLRGKTLYLQKPGDLAVRFLELAERIDPKASHVPDALWLHAECLKDLGRFDQALACYARIRSDFTTSDYFARAAERIAFCTGKLKPAGPAGRTPGK